MNLGGNLGRPSEGPEDTALVQDIFEKAHSFTRADEAEALGIYPYFKAISAQDGGIRRG